MSEHEVKDDEFPQGAGESEEVPPVPSASVILLRGEPFEVLLMRRTETSSFVPGNWVFPGGVIDPADGATGADEQGVARRGAIREVFEETGIWLGDEIGDSARLRTDMLGGRADTSSLEPFLGGSLERLVPVSRWVTPVGVPKRFDTWFYLATVENGTEGTPNEGESLELRWIKPADALALHRDGSMPMVFPTIRNLEALAEFDSASDLIESKRGVEIRTTRPVIVIEKGRRKIVIADEE